MIPDWVKTLLSEYAQQALEMSNLELNTDGVTGITFDDGAVLYFQFRNNQLYISYLFQSQGFDLLGDFHKLLNTINFKSPLPYSIQPGYLPDNTLTLTCLFHQNNGRVSQLNTIILQLKELAHEIVN